VITILDADADRSGPRRQGLAWSPLETCLPAHRLPRISWRSSCLPASSRTATRPPIAMVLPVPKS